jgi:hypothetical protein
MWAKYTLIVLYVALCKMSLAATPDSVKQKKYLLLLTPRFNTLNMAPVSGNIVNRNANVDLTVTYIKNRLMLTFMDAIDLEDRHSEMNYFLINARYKFNLTKKFSVSPFIAFYSEHAHQLFDIDSDANGGIIFIYQGDFLSVEVFPLLLRLTHSNSFKDVINRVEVKYKFQFITFSGFAYYNTPYFDNKERIAFGFKALLPEFKLFNKVNTRTDITGSFKIYENSETTNLNGVFLSLVFPLSI